jgi:glycosyltransferase involved in cell wall biosynthesis
MAPTICSSVQKVWSRARKRTGWRSIMARNLWFQKAAARRLKSFSGDRRTIFSYSYAAGEIFAEAKHRGWRTVLGQIDPGPVEARLVRDLYERAGQGHVHEPIPDEYWRLWRSEVDLADRIVVNSMWSREALVAEGVTAEKIAVIPLAYEGTAGAPARDLPTSFTPPRPLRLLFLGQVTLRKGIGVIFEAMRLLYGVPLHLDIVGPLQVAVPEALVRDPRITFHGSVVRSQVRAFYEQADIFLFPTHSDGFGLTQLEALSAGLPVIASAFCGDVVREGVDGHILGSLEPDELAELLRTLAADPARVARLQTGARVDEERFGLDAIGRQLEELFT